MRKSVLKKLLFISAPQITFLIPGYGSGSSAWSNNYEIVKEQEEDVSEPVPLSIAYNEKSLVEKIRNS